MTDISSMFSGCSNLENINLGNLDFSSVENMKNVFYECRKLTSIDLFKFDFSKVIDMSNLFDGCINLIDIKLSTKTSSPKKLEVCFKIVLK